MTRYRFDQIAENSTAKKKPEDSDRERYVGLEHLDPGTLEVTRWGAEVTPKGDKLLMERGDVLFGRRRAYQKKVGIAPFDGIFSAHGMVLRPRTDVVDPDFFPFFISSDVFLDEAIRVSVGSLSPKANWKDLKVLEFSLPTLDKQCELAGILSEAEQLKGCYRGLLATCDDIVKSQFVEMFERGQKWELRALAECCTTPDDIKCGPFGSQLHKEDYISEGVPVWGIPEVNTNFKHMPDKYVSLENGQRLQSYSLARGDIAMNRKGNVGQAALFDGKKPSGIIHSDVLRVRVNQDVLSPAFLVEQFHSSHVVREQIMSASTGAIMAGTNVTKLKKIKVFVPPLALQKEFADFVTQVDKSKFAVQQALDELNATTKKILNQELGLGDV